MTTRESKTNERRNSKAAANQRFGKNCISTHFAFTIQPKLAVNQSNDIYEQEADRIAEHVMGTPDVTSSSGRNEGEPAAITTVQRAVTSNEGLQLEDGDLETQLSISRGNGSPLPDETKLFMEQRFGADFSQVQIHADSEADDMNRQVSAHAFTHNQHIYFREGKYNPGSDEGKRLLAHELTHVVQQSSVPVGGTQHGGESAPAEVSSDVGDTDAIQREEDDEGWLGGLGSLVESAGSAVASGAEAVWDAGTSSVSSVGSTIASGTEGVASDVADFAGEAWQGAKGAAGDVANFGTGVYGQMKEDAGYIKQGEGMVEHGIDWLEDEAKGGTHWMAQQAKGIPVLEQAAGAGEWLANTAIDVEGGIWKGATGLVGGVLGAAANPVDTAKALWTMSEHIPGLGIPQKALHGAYDLAFSDKSLGDVADETLNPMADAKYWGGVGNALWSPYQKAIDDGKGGEALGRGIFDVGSLVLGVGEAGAAGKAGEVAKVAEVADAAKAAEVADAAKAAEVAETAKAAEGADAAKAASTGSKGGGAWDWVKEKLGIGKDKPVVPETVPSQPTSPYREPAPREPAPLEEPSPAPLEEPSPVKPQVQPGSNIDVLQKQISRANEEIRKLNIEINSTPTNNPAYRDLIGARQAAQKNPEVLEGNLKAISKGGK